MTMINVDKLSQDDVLKLSGWASLIWVSVAKENLAKTLKLMDSTITKKVLNLVIFEIISGYFYFIGLRPILTLEYGEKM